MSNQQNTMQAEVAELIVDSLKLDIAPSAIEPQVDLFGDQGLGLDSIDILELAFAISVRYGFQIKSGDKDNVQIFTNLATLTTHIEKNKTK